VTEDRPGVTRLRLDLRFDGTAFAGWAVQPGLRTVQDEIERALARVLRLPPLRVTVAGRTDAGVHARGQVAHVDVPAAALPPIDLEKLAGRLSGVLPDDVAVTSVRAADAGFDARFSAIWRRYTYRIADRADAVDPLRRADVLRRLRPLDEASMAAACPDLLGLRDFTAFCRSRPGATAVRTLQRLDCVRDADGLVVVDVQADAFCHSMVRSIVGALVAVGEGRYPSNWPAQIQAGKRRVPDVPVMPAAGLTLEAVGYPEPSELAGQAVRARALRVLAALDTPDGEAGG
jgi:tRNA pseudouridine38-40 synthase